MEVNLATNPHPETKYKRSKISFTITSIALTSYSFVLNFFLPLQSQWGGGVGSEPKIVAKRDTSVSNSAWESIFQMNVDFNFTTWKLGFLNISEYLAKYGIQMDSPVTERG